MSHSGVHNETGRYLKVIGSSKLPNHAHAQEQSAILLRKSAVSADFRSEIERKQFKMNSSNHVTHPLQCVLRTLLFEPVHDLDGVRWLQFAAIICQISAKLHNERTTFSLLLSIDLFNPRQPLKSVRRECFVNERRVNSQAISMESTYAIRQCISASTS